MRVHQLLSGAGPVDAVTNQARAYRRLFGEWGWGGADHAVHVDPRAAKDFRALGALDPAGGDVLVIHYSAYAPRLAEQLDRPQPKLLVSHNITPAKWFWDYEAMTAVQCTVGRDQLPRFAAAVDLAAGVSSYNARELAEAGARETAVIPILFDRGRLGEPGEPSGPPTVLFVGRLTPHKRHDLLIRAFALFRDEHAPEARLVLVGEPISPPYGEAVRVLGERLAPGAVSVESMLSSEELADRWRSAHAFLCLSEHEGFCIPVLEALHFGVPVVARATGGIPEVAGDAAILLPDEEPDLAVVAELLHLAVGDPELRSELGRRGEAQLQEFAFDRTAAKLREAIERLA